MSMILLVSISVPFVMLSLALGKFEIIVLAMVLLIAALVRSWVSVETRLQLECIPIIGEGLEVFRSLEEHYLRFQPKHFSYYLLYPLTSVVHFMSGRPFMREELSAHFSLVRWMVLLLIIEGSSSYFEVYSRSESIVSYNWIYVELLCIYFLLNFFLLPISTLSIKLSIQERLQHLKLINASSLTCLLVFTGLFFAAGNYFNVIPINIAIENHIKQIPDRADHAQIYNTRGLIEEQKTSANSGVDKVSFQPLSKLNSTNFVYQLEQELCAHLIEYLPQLDFTSSLRTEGEFNHFVSQLNERFQSRISRLSMLTEHSYFYLSLIPSQSHTLTWGMVAIPFRESVLYFFSYHHDRQEVQLYDRLSQISQADREFLSKAWLHQSSEAQPIKRLVQLLTQQVISHIKIYSGVREQASTAQETTEASPASSGAMPGEVPDQPTASVVMRGTQGSSELLEDEDDLLNTDPASLTAEKPLGGSALPDEVSYRGARKLNPTTMYEETPISAPQSSDPSSKSKSSQPQFKPLPARFAIFDHELEHFQFSLAYHHGLLREHHGEMPALPETWWIWIYSMLINALFWIFKITMPLHVFLIIYSEYKQLTRQRMG